MYELQSGSNLNIRSKVSFPYVNPGKKPEVKVGSRTYIRHAIKTHYVQAGSDDYIDIVNTYVKTLYKPGDILSISEKIVALCQNRVVYRKDIKVGKLAHFLSRYVHQTSAGEAVGNPYKMQLAINAAGAFRVLLGALVAAVTRPLGLKGWFYRIVGNNVANIDGFCSDAFDDYLEMGILSPSEPDKVCNEIKEKTGVSCMIVDANDYGVEILGVCDEIACDIDELKAMIIDNPAGQENQTTPMILIRKK